MDKLIGRERECDELRWALESQRSEFVVMYGRRRIGKIFLVRRFFDDKYSFHYVGAHKQGSHSSIVHSQLTAKDLFATV
jgi:AAA+ ATPase superfamily predicted ATPase